MTLLVSQNKQQQQKKQVTTFPELGKNQELFIIAMCQKKCSSHQRQAVY